MKYSIRVRGVGLIVAQTIFGLFANVTLNLSGMFRNSFPCVWPLLGQMLGICLAGATIAARTIRLKEIYYFHQGSIERYTEFNMERSATLERNAISRQSHYTEGFNFGDDAPLMDSGVKQFMEARYNIEKRANRKAWFLVIGALAINTTYCVIAIIVDGRLVAKDLFAPLDFKAVRGKPGLTRRGLDCPAITYWAFYPGYVVIVFMAVIGTPLSLWGIRRLRDTYGMRVDLFINLLLAGPSFALPFLAQFLLRNVLNADMLSWFGAGLGMYIMHGLNHLTAVILPICVNVRDLWKTKKLSINMESFTKVLEDPALFSILREFAVRDLCTEQIIFLEELKILKAKVAIVQRQNQSTSPLRIPSLPTSPEYTPIPDEPPTPVIYMPENLSTSPYRSVDRSGTIPPMFSNTFAPPTNANPETADQAQFAQVLYRRLAHGYFLPPSSQRGIPPDPRNNGEEPQRWSPAAAVRRSFQLWTSAVSTRPGGSARATRAMTPSRMSSARGTTVTIEVDLIPESLRSHFRTLCDVFVRIGSPMELNLSGAVRRQCVEAVDLGEFSIDMFDGPRDEVIRSLFENTFPKLVASIRSRLKVKRNVDPKDSAKLVTDAIIVV
ncbi:hypothetical protein BJ742DRAFT_780172 [Cladochytrium replicatum]|nr:hypothetical protein BJ742DRAFT_780172 [Cladochytrium replicatum]